MSDFDFINFLRIGDTDRGGKNTERRMDLEEKRKYIAGTTGAQAETLYEFTRDHPQEEPKSWRNLSIGALLGAGAGVALGALTGGLAFIPAAAVSFAITGGAIGAFADTKNTRRNNLLDEYEHYLDKVEADARQDQVPSIPTGIELRNDHAKEEAERRTQAATALAAIAGANTVVNR